MTNRRARPASPLGAEARVQRASSALGETRGGSVGDGAVPAVLVEFAFSRAERASLRGARLIGEAWTVADVIGACDALFVRTLSVRPARPGERPNALFQPALYQRDRSGVRPRVAADQSGEGSVVYADFAGDVADAAAFRGGEEREDGQSDRVGGGIGRVLVGPGRGVRLGGGSAGRGHGVSVRVAGGGSDGSTRRAGRAAGKFYRHSLSVPVDNPIASAVRSNVHGLPVGWHPLNVPQEVTLPRHHTDRRTVTDATINLVQQYRPIDMPTERWDAIREYVNDTTVRFLPHTAESRVKVQRTIAVYVDWAHHTVERDLTDEDLLDPELVVYFVANALPGMSKSTCQQYRAVLLRVVDRLLPERRRLLNVRSFGKNPAIVPFTSAELRLVLRWPMEQGTPYKRHAAACLVHFMLGAGLRHSELIDLVREDVVEDDRGVVVTVRAGRNPRVVPVLGVHEDAVVVLAGCVAPGAHIYRADQSARGVSATSAWVQTSLRPCLGRGFNPHRARSTWIVGHLDRGVSASALIVAAGLTSFTGLQRYAPHVTTVPVEQVRRELSVLELDRRKSAAWWVESAEYRHARNSQARVRARQREQFRQGVS